jgi:hypothetical protein
MRGRRDPAPSWRAFAKASSSDRIRLTGLYAVCSFRLCIRPLARVEGSAGDRSWLGEDVGGVDLLVVGELPVGVE